MKKQMVIAIVASITLACSCFGMEKLFGKTPTSEAPTLRMYSGMEPPGLDPGVIGADEPGGSCIPLLFTSLTEVDQEGKLAPGLAKTWETSPDGTRWTFHLRTDIPWVRYNPDTGAVEAVRPVTSGDVVYALRRNVQRLAYLASNDAQMSDTAWSYYNIKGSQEVISGSGSLDQLGVHAVDDQTIVIELISPSENFPLGSMIYADPAELVTQYGEHWTDPGNIWTNGPYYYVLPDRAQQGGDMLKASLVKNPLHPDSANNPVERIEVVYGIDSRQALEMYQNGELDVLPVQPEDLESILQDPQLSQQLYYGSRVRVVGLLFNKAKPPFDNPHVLKAFEYATNRDEIIQAVRGEGSFNVTACTGTLYCASCPAWMLGRLPTSYNPEVAKLNLELSGADLEAVLTEVEDLILMQVPEDAEMQAVANSLQAGWKDTLGMDVELKSLSDFQFDLSVIYANNLGADDALNIILLAGIWDDAVGATTSEDFLYLANAGQIEVFPLYTSHPDAYLVRGDRRGVGSFEGRMVFMSFTPASEISCPPVTQPSADELAAQCLEAVTQAKQAFEKHACEDWVPKSEDALLLATEALGIDSSNSTALFCRGQANYYLDRLPQALADLKQAQELGGSGHESELEILLPHVQELVGSPACSITPLQFSEGWQDNGLPRNPSLTYLGTDPTTIRVFWQLKGACNTVCQVKWKWNDTLACWHDYGSTEIPHNPKPGYEGSLYYNDDYSLLASGTWTVEVRCGSELVGEAEAVIP